MERGDGAATRALRGGSRVYARDMAMRVQDVDPVPGDCGREIVWKAALCAVQRDQYTGGRELFPFGCRLEGDDDVIAAASCL